MKTRILALSLALTLLGCGGPAPGISGTSSSSGGNSKVSSTASGQEGGGGTGGDGGGSSSSDGGASSSSSSTGGSGDSGSGGAGGGNPLNCTPGTSQCSGTDVQTCDTTGNWQTTSSCPFVCSNGSCSGICVPGVDVKCSGLVPQTCNPTGYWTSWPACPFACSNGACTGACTPNDTQCNGNTVQTCDSSGAWQDSQTCPYVCNSGVCSGVCTPGSAQCSGKTPQTCDASGQWTSGSTCPFLCSNGSCTGVCNPGDKKCSGSSTQTCDSSGQWGSSVACSAPAHATATCSGAGVCGFSCQGGFENCDGNSTNGCEADLSSPTTCGSCGNACSTVNGTASCSSGSCGITCNPGFGNCNAGAGCETQLGTTTNCLSCGNACASPANGTGFCGPTGCDFTCNTGHDDCDGNPANGCETNTNSDINNCGGCGITCIGVGATCTAGQCSGLVKVADVTDVTSLALGTPFSVNEVYWTTSGGTVEKAPTDGGTSTVLASGQTTPKAIQMTGSNVVWSNSAAPVKIRSMSTSGGTITDLNTTYGPVEMTNDGTNLYFTTRTAYDPCYCSDNSATYIYQLGLGGGTPTVINTQANSYVYPGWPGLVVTGNYVQRIQWYTTGPSSPYSPTIGQHKTNPADYYGGAGGGVYISGTFESFFSGRYIVKNNLDDMAMWTTLQFSGQAIVKMHSGQSPTLVAITSSLIVRGIAIDDTTVYVLGRFSAGAQDRLISYPLAGGMPTYLLDNLYNAANILVDDTHVYFSIDGTKNGTASPVLAPMIVKYEK